MSNINVSSFKEYVENEVKDKVIDFTEDGHCSNCGNCCNNILPVNKDEIKRIKSYIKKNKITESVTFLPIERKLLDMTCPFRDNINNCCRIYEVRPKICRLFLCNDENEVKKNRKKFADTRTFIDFRREFFDDSDW